MLKVKLNEEQVKIIDMLIAKESVVKISIEIGMSQRTVGSIATVNATATQIPTIKNASLIIKKIG